MSMKFRLVLAAAGMVALAALCGCSAAVSSGGHHRPPGGAWHWGVAGPRLVVIESTGIQYVADSDDEDIFFWDGGWYRWYDGTWYNCRSYGGSWVRIGEPPAVFLRIPPRHVKYRAVRTHVERRGAARGPQPAKRPHPHGKAKRHKR